MTEIEDKIVESIVEEQEEPINFFKENRVGIIMMSLTIILGCFFFLSFEIYEYGMFVSCQNSNAFLGTDGECYFRNESDCQNQVNIYIDKPYLQPFSQEGEFLLPVPEWIKLNNSEVNKSDDG